jgi:hypothetical protein
MDADSKLCLSWLVGERNPEYAYEFIKDIKERIANRIQLSTDGHSMYYEAIEDAFGGDVDYAMIVKHYGTPYDCKGTGRYSPPRIRSAKAKRLNGNPDMKKVSTSFVERQNLTMRMNMRRFTRLTNGFSKKIENHMYAIALHFMYYNFARVHKSLANPYPRTPAMASGISDHIWTTEEIVSLINPIIVRQAIFHT